MKLVNQLLIRGMITVLLCILHTSYIFAENALQVEIQGFVKEFRAGNFSRKLINELEWSGISDTRIYDLAEAVLLANYKSTDSEMIEQNSWLAKALSQSGQPKYRATLDKVLKSKKSPEKLVRHAKKARTRLEEFRIWNPIIAKDVHKAPAGKLNEKRAQNMLSSDNPVMLRLGAKRVYYKYFDDTGLLEIVKSRLLNDFNMATDGVHIDAVAWLCKALGRSGKLEYRSALETVTEKASNKKISRYAAKSLSFLQ